MSTDRELLEAAARAASYRILEEKQAKRDRIGCGHVGLWIAGGNSGWNPLTDDGDALTLAVKLRIKFERHVVHPFVAAWAPGIVGRFEESEGDDACAATRRAVVRAAAALGATVSTGH